MAEQKDVFSFTEFELKLREYHYKRCAEAQRFAVEFSKLIVTNLIWINAAGLGSLPVIVRFVGMDNDARPKKLNTFFMPGMCFAIGLLSALSCAIVAYWNFFHIAKLTDFECNVEINAIRSFYAQSHNFEEMQNQFNIERDKASIETVKTRDNIGLTMFLSHIFGWLSIAAFVSACYFLIKM